MKVALISPKGPLYRSSGGIFKKSLRYQPLTLTTLAALAPADLDIELELFDEGIGDVPLDMNADLVGMTVITGSSTRAYERSSGLPVPSPPRAWPGWTRYCPGSASFQPTRDRG